MNPTNKRINWINAGMTMLFGNAQIRAIGPSGPITTGLYGYIQQLQAWVNEGVVAGFIPQAPGGQTPPYPVVDADFAGTFPSCTAANFAAAITALQNQNTNYLAGYSALVAIKP
jgi:hypothetical protein